MFLFIFGDRHCMKGVQIRSFLWSAFSCTRAEYGDYQSKSPYSVWVRENTDQKKIRIWTLFTQWEVLYLLIFQCYFESETQILMAVFDIRFLLRDNFLESGFIFQLRGHFFSAGRVSILGGEGHPMLEHLLWWQRVSIYFDDKKNKRSRGTLFVEK